MYGNMLDINYTTVTGRHTSKHYSVLGSNSVNGSGNYDNIYC